MTAQIETVQCSYRQLIQCGVVVLVAIKGVRGMVFNVTFNIVAVNSYTWLYYSS